MSKKFKILSIDGGGFRGVYSAHLLTRIEEEYHINWCEQFNLIAGTSTGAIIAAALACEIPTKQIVDLYKTNGKKIFKKGLIPSLGFFQSKYENTFLKNILREIFGDKKLGDVKHPLILPSTDIANGCVHVFKSSYDSGFVRDKNILICEAVLASCSAPTYFNPIKVDKYLLGDGGLWANSPALVATIDAKKRLGQSLDNIHILSIGTGESKKFYPFNNGDLSSGWGFLRKWGRSKFIDMILNLQSQTSNNMLMLLLREDQLLRLNFKSDINLPLDDTKEFDDLITRADHTFTHNAVNIQNFLNQDNRDEK